MVELIANYGGLQLSWLNVRRGPYRAVSGQPGHQAANFQNRKDLGPIVEGTYKAKVRYDPKGVQFANDPGNPCRMVLSYDIQPINRVTRILPRQPGQTRPVVVNCAPVMAAWGKYRWRLEPDAATAKRITELGREGGFHIHGGGEIVGATSGCIRVNDDFWVDLLQLVDEHKQTLRWLKLTVKYLTPSSPTGGVL